jgi:hypothetical protein
VLIGKLDTTDMHINAISTYKTSLKADKEVGG